MTVTLDNLIAAIEVARLRAEKYPDTYRRALLAYADYAGETVRAPGGQWITPHRARVELATR